MDFVDYYKIMGLEPDAKPEDIKRTYRKLARKYHPDVSKEANSEARFKELGEAYNVLKDSERRKQYDNLRQHQGSDGNFNVPPDWQYTGPVDSQDFSSADAAQFSDFFEQMFGDRGRSRYSPHEDHASDIRGQDVRSKLSISLQDAFSGATVELTLRAPVSHDDGSIRYENKRLSVKVPKGVNDGQTIRLRGQGGPSIGNAKPGDLYITLTIEDDKVFHLDGRDITVRLPVTPWEVALGASVQVPTLSGTVSMSLPANSNTGKRLRLKRRGLPGEPPGDQYVVLTVVVPEVRNDEQREAYESMSKLWTVDPRSDMGD